MIYQIKRGRQDINLINDENPKKGYKFVLFVGENGSGKTNFLDFIEGVLKKSGCSIKQIDKITWDSKVDLSSHFCNRLFNGFSYVTKIDEKKIYLNNKVFHYSLQYNSENYKKWKLLFGQNSALSFNKKYENIDETELIKIETNNCIISISNKPTDVTQFYYSHFPVTSKDEESAITNFIRETRSLNSENVFSVHTIIDTLNNSNIQNGSVKSNVYIKNKLEQSIKSLFELDEQIADIESNIGDDSKKDVNKNFINGCLKTFYGEGKYIIDINKHLNKITLNGKHKPTIDNISDGVLHCLSLATYICENRNLNDAYFFIDEPETSLHPRAQLEFSKFLDNNKNNTNQVFIATHSPFIIKSFLENYPNDTKIIHFQHLKEKDKDVYKADKIENFIILDFLSISEINYHVYNIPSSEYYLQLYEHLKKITGNENNYFKDFDENYLKNKDFALEIIQKDSSTNETCLTRLRHLLAHGGDVKNEKGYNNYINKEFSPDDQTKEFYEFFTTNKDNLINKYTKTLIVLIKNYKNKQV